MSKLVGLIDRRELAALIQGQIGWQSAYSEHLIEEGHVTRFCDATGLGPADWRETVPPTFVVSVGWDEPQYQVKGLSSYGTRNLNGGDRFEYLRPVRIGDRIRSRSTFISATERMGRSGPLLISTFECLYLNQHDELVVRHLATRIRL